MTTDALLVIDMQRGFDDPRWGARNNPEAEANGLRVLAHWRARRWPVVIVRHDSVDAASPLQPGQPGNELKPGFEPLAGELVVGKCVNSALIGTALEAWLRDRDIGAVTIFGITSDQCVSTTARMASNLGFRTTVVEDACACFGQTTTTGQPLSAEALHVAHMTTLHTEFARVVTTNEVTGSITTLAELRNRVPPPSELVRNKVLDHLDVHARAFIALSPMVIVGTHGATGHADVSPRGDAPGFVAVHGDRCLVIPERPGNRLADSLRNVIETGEIGMLFLIPGIRDALRVNGRAWVTTSPEVLVPLAVEGKPPAMAIVVHVRESYLHCARWSYRSKLWEPASWPASESLPSLAQMLVDQVGMPHLRRDELDTMLREMYATELY